MGPGRRKDHAPEGFYTVSEAAELLSLTPSAIRQRIQRGTLETRADDVTDALEPRHYIPKAVIDREVREKNLPANRGHVDDRTQAILSLLQALGDRAQTQRDAIEQAVKEQDEHISSRLDKLQANQEAMREGLTEAIKVLREAAEMEKRYQERMMEMLDREAERQESLRQSGQVERRSWIRRMFFDG
jgi:predicted transcriptional regulator